MDRKIIWTEQAWTDLETAADNIAKDSPYYAATFVREVRDAARSLATFAERGRVVPEFGDPTVRELFVRKYRLMYKVGQQSVHILSLIHGARDVSALWEKERRPFPENVS